jgi:hypothetical protein
VGHRKLLYLEKLFATLLLAGPQVGEQLRGRLQSLNRSPGELSADLQTQRQTLLALEAVLTFWLPAVFRVGFLVRQSYWAGRDAGSGNLVYSVLGHCLLLLVQLLGPLNASKDNYVRTLSCALLTWVPWMAQIPGYCFVEECCEAMLSRFGHRLEVHTHVHSYDDTYNHIDFHFYTFGHLDQKSMKVNMVSSLLTQMRQ